MSSVRRSSSSGGRPDPSPICGLFGAGPSGGLASVIIYSRVPLGSQKEAHHNRDGHGEIEADHPSEERKLPADGSKLGLEVADAVLEPSHLLGSSLCALFVSARLLQRAVQIAHHHRHVTASPHANSVSA